jgi:hypothetical protein
MTQFPPVIKDFLGEGNQRPGVYNNLHDPARLLVERTRYERPKITAGPASFEWPLGVEGVTISGTPTLAEHRYLGDKDVVLQVTHADDQRIILTGQFSGLTGTRNMSDLMTVIRAPQPPNGKVLSLPRIVFPNLLYVVIADYSFDHPQEDRNNSWDYTITFRRIAIGKLVKKPKSITSPVNPRTNKGRAKPRGKSSRIFTVHAGGNTLRAVAKLVYGNSNRWNEIYNKNTTTLKKLGVPMHLIPTKRLPYGMKLTY